MIDDDLLATYENRVSAAMRESENPIAIAADDPAELIEIIRNARRYLALRERFITEWLCNHDYGPGKELESSSARLHLDIPSTTAGIGVPPTSPVDAIVIDAAADRMLEGGE